MNNIKNQLQDFEKISLPVIANVAIKSKKEDGGKIKVSKLVNSNFYQTSQMICFTFFKPLYIADSHEKL